MPATQRTWATNEARAGLAGLLSTLPNWLNHPTAIGHADRKPIHLFHAAQCGLQVPRTIITNDPHAARAFVRDVGRAVYKTLAQQAIADDSGPKVMYTTPVAVDDIDESVGITAHMFQERVDKQYDVRLTVVDGQCFAARIDSLDQLIDWRADYAGLTYTTISEIPLRVRTAVHTLMSRLRLRFAAIDFAVTGDDAWFFLDLNANGQWAWIQDATGQPISAAIADALIRERPHHA
jgi:glutathione synthase/RimK-type ligase-like ATP-grasp enzyme